MSSASEWANKLARETCWAADHDDLVESVSQALDAAREQGRMEERERCCEVLQARADANIRAAKLKEGDGNSASAESHEMSATWLGEAIEQIRAQWAITAIRAPEGETEPETCGISYAVARGGSAPFLEHGEKSLCIRERDHPGSHRWRKTKPEPDCLCHETTVGKECPLHDVREMAEAVAAPKPESLRTWSADGREIQAVPPEAEALFAAACARGDIVPAKPEPPCSTCGGGGSVVWSYRDRPQDDKRKTCTDCEGDDS